MRMKASLSDAVEPAVLAEVLDALTDAIAVVDGAGRILHANRAFRAAAAGQAAPVAGDDGDDDAWLAALRGCWGVPAAQLDALRPALVAVTGGEISGRTAGWSVPHPDGTRALTVTVSAAGAGRAIVTVRDDTAAHAAAAHLAAMQQRLAEAEERLRCFSEITSETMVISDRGRILFANAAANNMFQLTSEEVVGKSVLDFSAPECHAEVIAHVTSADGDRPYESVCIRKDGTRFVGEVRGRPIRYHGRPVRGATILDVTERKNVEAALRRKEREEARARAEADTLAALATPIIPVSDEVVVMPLVGAFDAGRMARVTELLLAGVAQSRVRFAILDITGVPALDGTTAAALLRAAQGVRLLGAQAIVSGVSAEVATRLVRSGADLTGLWTQRDLRTAVAQAFGQAGTPRRAAREA